MGNFNEEDVKLFYKLLNHKEDTEIRFIKRGVYPAYKIVRNESDFVNQCRIWNGKRNIYAGIRNRKPGLKKCATASDIIGLQTITVDIDPVRASETPSTDEEIKNAIKVARVISEWFKKNLFKKPFSAMTGNGTCLYFSVPYLKITDTNRNEIPMKLERFEADLRKIFKKKLEHYNCRIDSMYDLPRIAKVIGTLSVKGKESIERPWRLSRWIEKPNNIYPDDRLLNAIINEDLSYSYLKELSPKTPGLEHKSNKRQIKPVWLMQPIPYFGEKLEGKWAYEAKVDGWRLEIIKKNKHVEFWGRRLEKKPDWTEKLKALPKELLKDIPDGTILDAELYTEKGRRLIPSLFTKNPKAKPIVFIFDIITYKNKFIGNMPLYERKKFLKSLKFEEPFRILEFKKVKNLEEHLKECIKKGFEGIVIKELQSQYSIGKDSPMATQYWRKIKPSGR
jgi:hypothetical protein